MHTQVLLALTRAPWSSLYQLADGLQLLHEEIQARLDECVAATWVQVIEQGQAHFPRRLFAPTQMGIAQLAQWLDVPESVLIHHLGCTPFRFESLRSGLPVAREVAQFNAGLLRACRARGEEFSWEAFIQRRYKGVELAHPRPNQHKSKWRMAGTVFACGQRWRAGLDVVATSALFRSVGASQPRQHATLVDSFVYTVAGLVSVGVGATALLIGSSNDLRRP